MTLGNDTASPKITNTSSSDNDSTYSWLNTPESPEEAVLEAKSPKKISLRSMCRKKTSDSPKHSPRSKSMKCTHCGNKFVRGTHLRGPHPSHTEKCPRHPYNFHSGYDYVDGQIRRQESSPSNVNEGTPQPGPSKAPPSGVYYDEDDEDDEILLRGEDFLVRQIGAKSWSSLLKNQTYRIYMNESYLGEEIYSIQSRLRDLFQEILNHLAPQMRDEYKFRLFLDSPSLPVPITFHIRDWRLVTVGDIMDTIKEQLQSHQDLKISTGITIDVGVFIPPGGEGYLKLTGTYDSIEKEIKRRAQLVFIDNEDVCCLARAIIVGYVHTLAISHSDYEKLYGTETLASFPRVSIKEKLSLALEMKKCSRKLFDTIRKESGQRSGAKWLCDKAGLDIDVKGRLQDLPKYEEILKVKIHVLLVGEHHKFITPSKDPLDIRPTLYLLYNRENDVRGHFHTALYINGVFGSQHFCDVCLSSFKREGQHLCRKACFHCRRPRPLASQHDDAVANVIANEPLSEELRVTLCLDVPGDTSVRCPDCNGNFPNKYCFNHHKKKPKKRKLRQEKAHNVQQPLIMQNLDDMSDEDEDPIDDDVINSGHSNAATGQQEGHSPCELFWFCPRKCGKRYLRSVYEHSSHTCLDYFCYRCRTIANESHECYIRALNLPKTNATKPHRFIFFDIETTQTSSQTCGDYTPRRIPNCGKCFQDYSCRSCRLCRSCNSFWCSQSQDPIARVHTSIYIAVKIMCLLCFDLKDIDGSATKMKCGNCGSRCATCAKKPNQKACLKKDCCLKDFTFSGIKSMHKFATWLFQAKHKGAYVLAHNGSAFDNYALLEWMLAQKIVPSVVYKGSRIIRLVHPKFGIKVMDTFLYLTLPLAKLPAAFGLSHLMSKGFCAHFFTSEANMSYVSKIWPPKEDYGYDQMSPETRSAFLTWYESKISSGTVYNHKKELASYCVNDTLVLAMSTMAFIELMTRLRNMVPFVTAVTLSSYVLKQFRTYDLREEYTVMLHDGTSKNVYKRAGVMYYMDPVTNERVDVSKDDVKHANFLRSDIAFIPRGRLTGLGTKYSRVSMEWLSYEASKLPASAPEMRTALSPNGEQPVAGSRFKLDGYVGGAIKIMYDFHVSICFFFKYIYITAILYDMQRTKCEKKML